MGQNNLRERWRRRYRHFRDVLKFSRRQVRRVLHDPVMAAGMVRFRRNVRSRRWQVLRDAVPDLGKRAIAARDPQLLSELRLAAEQLELYELASAFDDRIAALRGRTRPDEWRGEPLDDVTLVIDFMESEKQGAAAGLRLTGHVAAASARAKRTVLVVERRLVPLYQRSFPSAEVLAGPTTVGTAEGGRMVVATMRVLRTVLGSDETTIRKLYRPLQADPEAAARFRRSYRGGQDLPLIGISWWSSHHGKELPPLEAWAELMRNIPARFVNVQYGDVAADLHRLRELSGREIIDDRGVDQLKDMDLFAAQLAALDAVVAISCTGAHLAAALQVPTVIVRDDWFRREWPVLSARTPWCPSAVVVGREGADWPAHFAAVEAELRRFAGHRETQEGRA